MRASYQQEGRVRIKQNEKSSFINEINKVSCRVTKQHSLLNEFHKMKMELKTTKEQFEKCINQGKQRSTEMTTTIANESKKRTVFIFIVHIFFFLLYVLLNINQVKPLSKPDNT